MRMLFIMMFIIKEDMINAILLQVSLERMWLHFLYTFQMIPSAVGWSKFLSLKMAELFL